MKKTFKLVSILLLSATLSTISISCGDNAKQMEEAVAKQKEEDAARQKEAELQEKNETLERARRMGRDAGAEECESSFSKYVQYFDTRSSITPLMEQEKTKCLDNRVMILRSRNKYDLEPDLLEKAVEEFRRGFNEGWSDMFDYFCNRQK